MADITEDEVSAAIRRALLNGETWETGDIKSHISLERLMEIRDTLKAEDAGMSFQLASFSVVKADAD